MADGTYLGDGLYASFDGYQFVLRAPREDGDHWVALEPKVMDAFLVFMRRAHEDDDRIRDGKARL